MKVFIGVIGAGVLGVALAASAQSTSSSTTKQSPQSSTSQPSAQTPSTQSQSSGTMPSSDSSASTSSATQSPVGQSPSTSSAGQMPSSQAQNELAGVVKKIDKSKHSVRISSAVSGEKELTLSPSVTILRDGNQISFEQLKEGDQVRASFDPSSSEVTKINVESKSSTDQGKTKSDTSGKGK